MQENGRSAGVAEAHDGPAYAADLQALGYRGKSNCERRCETAHCGDSRRGVNAECALIVGVIEAVVVMVRNRKRLPRQKQGERQ